VEESAAVAAAELLQLAAVVLEVMLVVVGDVPELADLVDSLVEELLIHIQKLLLVVLHTVSVLQ
jgi:hypothetical protein